LQTSDFFYTLPPELIAQEPIAVREASRMLVLRRSSGELSDRIFSSLPQYLQRGDVLVRNTSRVIPARLYGFREDTSGRMEFLLIKRIGLDDWEALVKPGRRAKIGLTFVINDELSATIISKTENGCVIRLHYNGVFEEVLERAGHMPLPPYITHALCENERYQTVYAHEHGSVAAPTAGLHFTEALLERLRAKGIVIVDLLLHVGLGTFKPVSAATVEEHKMHSEYYELSESAAAAINSAKKKGGRIVAVGTTSCRVLESVADEQGVVHAKNGWTDIFIKPGHVFRAVDALITNFHLPESTLLMLVSALAGKDNIMNAYTEAISLKYRFFSFGDAMLIK